MIININAPSQLVPGQIDGTTPPRQDQLCAAGFREVNNWPLPDVSPGMQRGPITFEDAADGWNATAKYQDTPIPVPQPVVVQIPATVQAAGLEYQAAMRRSFPSNPAPETDRTLTVDAVTGYFLGLAAQRALTPQEITDESVLQAILPTLCAYSPDGTAWGFPFGQTSFVKEG